MTGKHKYSKHSDEKEIDYPGIRSIVDCLEILEGAGRVVEQLQRATNTCFNPSKKMQSIADQISIVAQSLSPKIAKLDYLRGLYRTEFQNICEHKWSDYDEYETCIGGDDNGGRVVRVRLCELCHKTE